MYFGEVKKRSTDPNASDLSIYMERCRRIGAVVLSLPSSTDCAFSERKINDR